MPVVFKVVIAVHAACMAVLLLFFLVPALLTFGPQGHELELIPLSPAEWPAGLRRVAPASAIVAAAVPTTPVHRDASPAVRSDTSPESRPEVRAFDFAPSPWVVLPDGSVRLSRRE